MSTRREQPPRLINYYTLTADISSTGGLTNVPIEQFTKVIKSGYSGTRYYPAPVAVNLGFDFIVTHPSDDDGMPIQWHYDKIVIAPNGYAILYNNSFGFTTPQSVILSTMDRIDDSTSIFAFGPEVMLLCPWFTQMQILYDSVSQINGTDMTITPTKQSLMERGMMDIPDYVNPRLSGVWTRTETDSAAGRRTVIRWCARADEYNGFGGPLNSTLIGKIVFECVIYENGKIEFRYAPLEKFFNSKPPSSTFNTGSYVACGVFVGSNYFGGEYFWRDFSVIQPDQIRQRNLSPFGGAAWNPGWQDTTGGKTTDYSHSMLTSTHWFGREKFGATITFAPPASKLNVLPRLALRKLDRLSAGSEHVNFQPFDDRTTINFNTNVIKAPAMLPRSIFGTTQLNTALQPAFGEEIVTITDPAMMQEQYRISDFVLTSSVSQGLNEHLAEICAPEFKTGPYCEDKQFTLQTPVDNFYLTGTALSTAQFFTSQLRDKTQIKLAFPIDHKTTLQDVTGSVLYYNTQQRKFEVIRPQDGKMIIASSGLSIDSDNDWNDTSHRLFTPYGTSVASGTIFNSSRETTGIKKLFFGDYYGLSEQALHEALQVRFSNDVLNCYDYVPNNRQVFNLPIDRPFLIEKLVIDLPIEAGPGWFNDRTRFSHISAGGVGPPFIDGFTPDQGGPAVAISLLHSIIRHDAANNDLVSASFRNLIASGVFTHINDHTSSLDIVPLVNSYGSLGKGLQITGFKNFGTPGGIVGQNVGTQTFTGSVQVNMTAAVSNGLFVKITRKIDYDGTPEPLTAAMTDIFCSKFVPGFYDYTSPWTTTILHVNPFQRNNCGLVIPPDGRSIFGKQYASPSAPEGADSFTWIKNPFYVSSSLNDVPTYLQNFTSGSTATLGNNVVIAGVNLEKSEASPYLVYPGDNLVIALSKCKSAISGTHIGGGNIHYDFYQKHDIKVNTGTMYVTLYGSYVGEDKEVHDISQRVNDSRSVYSTVIGGGPILDQFEAESYLMFYNSYTDAYVTGTMVTKTTETIPSSGGTIIKLITGSRGAVFSKMFWYENPMPFSGSTRRESVRYDNSISYANDQHVVSYMASEERIYDSMMPGISELMRADGSQVTRHQSSIFAGAILFLDWPRNIPGDRGESLNANEAWFYSFPFEPRYNNIKRNNNVARTFISAYTTDFSTLTPAKFQEHDSLWVFAPNFLDPATSESYYIDFDWSKGWGSIAISGMTSTDAIKFLFGYAHSNIRKTGTRAGVTTQFCSNNTPKMNHVVSHYYVKPVIEGWKYGVYSGLPAYPKCFWRRGKFGQFRDMLEQRIDTKFVSEATVNSTKGVSAVLTSPVTVRFVDKNGNATKPENTWSSNLSFEATSSLPYFDGEIKNRIDPNAKNMNLGVLVMNQDLFGNIKV